MNRPAFVPSPPTARNAARDCAVGAVIALVSIPISMGYALVAGLPVEAGLFGSLLPPLCFALATSSRAFVFGVDAAPAALVGGMLATLGIAPRSAEAARLIPAVALAVSAFLLALFAIRAHRALKFISEPVMGGFITGIGTTIILMQTPRLFGGSAGSGEARELVLHIVGQAQSFHALSFALGLGTTAAILAMRRLAPKIPVQPLLMFAGAAATRIFRLDEMGVATLPHVPRGLPPLSLPDVTALADLHDVLLPSLSIAAVILSETLLASENAARKSGGRLDGRREILAYAAGNAAAAVCGCCPVNGSVSRSGIAAQFGAGSQLMSVSAAAVMAAILAFGTGFIGWLPVPVLTGIVVAALAGTLEFRLAARLRRLDKIEFFIFYGAFAAVLLLGTIYGVLVGALLSGATFMFRQSRPSTDFLGVVPGMRGWYSLTRRGTAAQGIRGAVVYQFSAPLFYANIDQFCQDIRGAIRKDTRVVVVEAGGIGSVDATAAARLVELWRECCGRGVRLFVAGHAAAVNAQLRAFGAEILVFERAVVPRVSLALEAAGIEPPYPLENPDADAGDRYSPHLAEFEWAFGDDADALMDEFARRWNEHERRRDRDEIDGERYFAELAMENPPLARRLADKIAGKR